MADVFGRNLFFSHFSTSISRYNSCLFRANWERIPSPSALYCQLSDGGMEQQATKVSLSIVSPLNGVAHQEGHLKSLHAFVRSDDSSSAVRPMLSTACGRLVPGQRQAPRGSTAGRPPAAEPNSHQTPAAFRRTTQPKSLRRHYHRQSLRVQAGLLDWIPGMGASGSKANGGWQPSPGEGSLESRVSKSGCDITPMTMQQREEASKSLTSFQKRVTLRAGTEPAFSGQTTNGIAHDNKSRGTYVSAVGGLPLFSSDAKFESGTGWPSFWKPVDPEHVLEVKDNSIPFMPRVEVVDARSGAHLGHVFNDGPPPTYKRYCINAAALTFVSETDKASK